MAGRAFSEVILAQVCESKLSDKKENVCECCEIIKLEVTQRQF